MDPVDSTVDLLQKRYERSDRMVGRRIAGEYVLVPIVGHGADLDSIYTLNALGAFIWERLDGKTTGASIVEAIAERYDVDAARAAKECLPFLAQLRTIEAIIPADDPES